jgi:hypothetical protein
MSKEVNPIVAVVAVVLVLAVALGLYVYSTNASTHIAKGNGASIVQGRHSRIPEQPSIPRATD